MGVCILGMGDCEQRTETRTDVLNAAVNKTVKNNMTKQMQKNAATSQQVNAIELIAKGDIDISGVKQKIYSTISLDSLQKITSAQELKAMLSQAADTAIEKEIKAEKGFMGGAQYTGDIQNIKNIVSNTMTQNTSVEQVNECIAGAYNKNVITAESGGNITLQAVDQEIVSDVAANCIAEQSTKDITENVALQEAINDLNAKIAAESKGPLDVFGDIIEKIGIMLGSVGGIIFAIALIVGIVLVAGFLIFYLWPKRGVSPSSEQVIKQVTKTAKQAGGGLNFTKTFRGINKILWKKLF